MSIGLVLAAGLWAYHNSFAGPFILDDINSIRDNPSLRHPWSLAGLLGGTTRPVVALSFALNYALGGLTVWGYHAVNLAIHLTAAVLLCGLVRRTLRLAPLRDRFGSSATGLASAVALLWVVHPLQTESVTYLVQRAESLTGLWHLLTLYGVLRGVTTPPARPWFTVAIISCALGMASKPVMVVAPLTALLYDRVFLARSWREVFGRRRGLYLGLAATWGLLAMLLAVHLTLKASLPGSEVGFRLELLSPFRYALTQLGVIGHYLRLACWPRPLVLDYLWPPAMGLAEVAWPGLVGGALLGATAWAWRARPASAFLGVWFFLTLAPSSSVIPIEDVAFEHRMYLPLSAVVSAVVLLVWASLRRIVASELWRRRCAAGLAAVVVLVFGWMTARRNTDYRSELVMWRDIVAKRPENFRAHNTLGATLARERQTQEAIAEYDAALRLRPTYAEARYNLGIAYQTLGDLERAIASYEEAIRLKPDLPDSHHNLGVVLALQGRLEEAASHYETALRLLGPVSEDAGRPVVGTGRFEPAHYAETHHNLGLVLARQGRLEDARRHFLEALRLNPNLAVAHQNLGRILVELGRPEEAERHFRASDSLIR